MIHGGRNGTKKTVCFTGYRPNKFDFSNQQITEKMKENLTREIWICFDKGYQYYLFGGCAGFDIYAAEIAFQLKQKEKIEVSFICALPYEKFRESKEFDSHWQLRYDEILKAYNEIFSIDNKLKYYAGCYMKRNKWLVDHSSRVICLYNNQKGGTANTIHYAKEKKLDIINVYPK